MALGQCVGSNKHPSQNNFVREVVTDASVVTENNVFREFSGLLRTNRDLPEVGEASGNAIDSLIGFL